MSKNKDSSLIDQKKAEKTDDKVKSSVNVGSFMLSVLKALLSVSTYIYLGVSILIFSKYYRFNKMQGTNVDSNPYVNIGTTKIGGSVKQMTQEFYNNLFGLTGWRFPYNIVDGSTKDPSTWVNIVSWFTESMAFSFAKGREILETIFKFIGLGIYGNKESAKTPFEAFLEGFVLIFSPAIILLIFHLFPLFFTIPTIIYSMVSKINKVWIGLPLFIIGLFLFYSWFYISFIFGGIGTNVLLTSAGQLILFWLFMFFGISLIPNSGSSFKNIIFNRLPIILTLFFGFLIQPAFSDLGQPGGYLFLGATICSFLLFLSNFF